MVELDVRKLIFNEAGNRGQTVGEASKEALGGASRLTYMIDGSRGISGKTFCQLIRAWKIHKDRDKLRQWLCAFLLEKLGPENRDIIEATKLFNEGACRPPERDVQRYTKLGVTVEAAKRRLAILRAASRGQGLLLSDAQSVARDTGAVVRTDMKWLERRKLVSSEILDGFMPRMDHPFIQRPIKQRAWYATREGKKLLELFEGYEDAQGAATEAVQRR